MLLSLPREITASVPCRAEYSQLFNFCVFAYSVDLQEELPGEWSVQLQVAQRV